MIQHLTQRLVPTGPPTSPRSAISADELDGIEAFVSEALETLRSGDPARALVVLEQIVPELTAGLRPQIAIREHFEAHPMPAPTYVAPPRDVPDAFVYFLRLRDLIKIGTSVDVRSRIRNHPHEEVLLILHGSYSREAQVHAALDAHRVAGFGREWFAYNDEVRAFVADLARLNPDRPTWPDDFPAESGGARCTWEPTLP